MAGYGAATRRSGCNCIREAIALGVDYVDLEQDIAGKIRRFGKTKRIVSYHNLKTTPTDIQDIAEKSDELDPDIVKVATSALTLADASRVLHLAVTGKFPTIPIAMGEIGVFTRILGAKFGAPFTYAGFNPERVFAAGMQPVPGREERLFLQSDRLQDRDLRRDRRPDRAEPEPRGAQCRVPPPGTEQGPGAVSRPRGELETFFRELLWLEIKGCSVTIPHKEAIVPLLQQKEGAVERTGSCNTVVFDADGRRIGYNTDYRAAMDSSRPPWAAAATAATRIGEPADRQAGADPGSRRRGPVDRLWPDEARGPLDDHQSARRACDQPG